MGICDRRHSQAYGQFFGVPWRPSWPKKGLSCGQWHVAAVQYFRTALSMYHWSNASLSCCCICLLTTCASCLNAVVVLSQPQPQPPQPAVAAPKAHHRQAPLARGQLLCLPADHLFSNKQHTAASSQHRQAIATHACCSSSFLQDVPATLTLAACQ